jgi:UDP-3-O-[3-hydroxymyristoyl] glucosamine N-acyltransferase
VDNGEGLRLADLAVCVGAELLGDGEVRVTHADTIQDATAGAICFLANSKYRQFLPNTGASAVILSRADAAHSPVPGLISENPYLTYARVASQLYPVMTTRGGIHASAVVAAGAVVDPSAWVGPCENSRLIANVTLCSGTIIGRRVLIHPGAVIGSDGFGNANDQGAWVKVPQIGIARIGDDVEIGANTTVDRGALRDTVIADGVRLDNQIQIAHNVYIGEHTAIAGCAGVAGSTTIGKYCTVGGGVGISGHLEIGDNVHFSGQTLVTRSFKEPGYYSGNLPAVPNGEWRKTIARIRRLEGVMQRLVALEQQLDTDKHENNADDRD